MTEVQLFSTCLAEEFFPEVNDAAATVLERLRLKVTPVRGAFCCGQVAFNEGMREEAVELARRFLNSVEPNIPIVVPSGSCTSMLKIFYGDLLAGDSVLAAHNSIFDITLLNQEIARVFPGCRMRNAELCTVQLARRTMPNLEKHHLDALADHFGFEVSQRHRAAGDARATARVLLCLLDELEMRGVRTLSEARKFRATNSAPRAELELAFDS